LAHLTAFRNASLLTPIPFIQTIKIGKTQIKKFALGEKLFLFAHGVVKQVNQAAAENKDCEKQIQVRASCKRVVNVHERADNHDKPNDYFHCILRIGHIIK
jgi:4-hydroxy-3-methylbut-2-enyl diphosphate reductase IspH